MEWLLPFYRESQPACFCWSFPCPTARSNRVMKCVTSILSTKILNAQNIGFLRIAHCQYRNGDSRIVLGCVFHCINFAIDDKFRSLKKVGGVRLSAYPDYIRQHGNSHGRRSAPGAVSKLWSSKAHLIEGKAFPLLHAVSSPPLPPCTATR